MTVRSKIYRLPAPELPDPANGPTGFENLARAVEGQAFPGLQSWGSSSGDISKWSEPLKASKSITVYSANLPTNGVVGWVDIDVNVWGALNNQEVGTAGFLIIRINGVDVRQIRWHNWWRIQNNCVYNSVRWSNLSGLPVKVDVIWTTDSNGGQASVYLLCYDLSYQIYGKKVT